MTTIEYTITIRTISGKERTYDRYLDKNVLRSNEVMSETGDKFFAEQEAPVWEIREALQRDVDRWIRSARDSRTAIWPGDWHLGKNDHSSAGNEIHIYPEAIESVSITDVDAY